MNNDDNDKPMMTLDDLKPPRTTQFPGTVYDVTAVYFPQEPKELRLAVEGFSNITAEGFRPIQQGRNSDIMGLYQDADGALWYLAHELVGTATEAQWIIKKAAEPADSPA